MGKIRVRTVGDEELEKQQQEEAKKRAESKRAEKGEEETVEAAPEEAHEKKTKKEKFQKTTTKGSSRSKAYQGKAALVDKSKNYTLDEALAILPELSRGKFDETVEVHFTTIENGVSGSVVLPHGTGKQTRVIIARGSDQQEIEALVKNIESGIIDFDILIATPDAMPKLARVARVLGPRGLMPNPKNGTVTPNPDDVAKKFEGGQVNFKTEAKFPLLHLSIGKISFKQDQLKDNVKAVMGALDKKQIKNATLKSTMSPAIKLDLASL